MQTIILRNVNSIPKTSFWIEVHADFQNVLKQNVPYIVGNNLHDS